MSELLELAERCEAAKEADTSWLMKDVGAVAYGHGSDAQKCRRFYRLIREGAYLDAAMTLVPEGAHCGMGQDGGPDGKGWAWVRCKIGEQWREFSCEPRFVANMTLALCAAALRSHYMSREG